MTATVAIAKTFFRRSQGAGPQTGKGGRTVLQPAARGQRQEKPERAIKRDGRAPARSGNDTVAWEFRTPGWYQHPVGLLTVLDTDRLVAMQYVFELGRTSGDVDCGHIDLVRITRAEARKLGRRTP